MNVNLAVVGATGAVGTLMGELLAAAGFTPPSIRFLASAKSAGQEVTFRGQTHRVELLTPGAFRGVQIVLSSTPAGVSREFSPIAADHGAYVVDNSSAWRMDPDCPLVVPEVNAAMLDRAAKRIVANPNCVAIPLAVVLAPLAHLAPLSRVVVSTYQSSSGKGATGLKDFDAQSRAWGAGEPVPAPTAHKGQLAGNVLTLDWTLDDNDFTEEENKVVNETRKILGLPGLAVNATCVRVPVRVAHSLSAYVEFERPVSAAEAKAALSAATGVRYLDERRGPCADPLTAAGSDLTLVSRVRQDPGNPRALNLWAVADNLRKGAALNAVQCAAELVRRGLVAG